jgi:predicted DNA-binding WGR domain protein
LERGLLLARSGYAEHAGEVVLSLLAQRECPLALLDALAPTELGAFEVRVLGERFERPRLGDLAFGPRAERLYCVLDREILTRHELSSGEWIEAVRAPHRIRALDCDHEPILTYGEGPQPVVRVTGSKLRRLPGPKSHGGRDLLAGLVPGAYSIRGARSLRSYAETPGKSRAIWSLSVGMGEDVVGLGPGGAVTLSMGGTLEFFEVGSRQPSHQVDARRHCPGRTPGTLGFRMKVQRAGAGAQLVYALGRSHAHGLSWIAPDGQLQGWVELPFGPWRWAASPSGRYALVLAQEQGRAGPNHSRTNQVFLADLERQLVRELTLPALPGGLAWSRTGRSFAISTEEGTVLLGQADATMVEPPAPTKESAPERGAWRELYKAQRFWRVRQEGARVELHYGARGAAGVQRSKEFATSELAAKDLARRVRQKRRGGYAP